MRAAKTKSHTSLDASLWLWLAAQPSGTKSVFFGGLGALFHPGAFLHPQNILALKTAQNEPSTAENVQEQVGQAQDGESSNKTQHIETPH
jgi:hypothetical protein